MKHEDIDHTGLTGVGGGTALVGSRVVRTAANLTTTSTTFVDATSMSITLTTGAHQALIGVVCLAEHDTAGDNVKLQLDVDGTALGGTDGVANVRWDTASYRQNMSFTWMTAALTAAAHTFKLQFATRAAGTAVLHASGTQSLVLWVQEMPF